MSDREKVIRKLQDALENAEEDWKIYAEIRRPVLFDAIELLKEQEHKDRMFHALEEDWKMVVKEQEAKTGHWNGPECSCCHAILEKRCRFEYCPHCGAKMELDV